MNFIIRTMLPSRIETTLTKEGNRVIVQMDGEARLSKEDLVALAAALQAAATMLV
jgi:hypothetical protein